MNVCVLEIKKHILFWVIEVMNDIWLSQILEWQMKIKRCLCFCLPFVIECFVCRLVSGVYFMRNYCKQS